MEMYMPEPRFCLPLNWSWGQIDKRLSIPLASGPAFVHSAVVTEAENERALIDTLARQYPDGFVFKSCGLDFLERASITPPSRMLFAYSAKGVIGRIPGSQKSPSTCFESGGTLDH
jgi:hypothetical protein